MLPADLKSEYFRDYPPEARKLAIGSLGAMQTLPLSFLPSLLREVIDYDFKFSAERTALEKELANLAALSEDDRKKWMQPFLEIELSSKLEQSDWVNTPAQFVEQLSSHLWTTHQLDAFRKAATDYAGRLREAVPPQLPAIPRLGIAVIGQGVASYAEPLFRKLHPHGVHFNRIRPENGMNLLLDAVAARAKSHPEPYGHWYIDGGEAVDHDSQITCVSYKGLEAARAVLLRKMRGEIERPGMGPEALRTLLAQMRPADLGLEKSDDKVLSRFQIKLLTEGSGTQIFSTTFAQWAARETLRRAQPLTLLVRFAPRQRQKPMNELLSTTADRAELDVLGSLIDGDMGAYYNWLNQQRLPGSEQSSFLVWFEGHDQALAIAPALPRGTESTTAAGVGQLLSWIA